MTGFTFDAPTVIRTKRDGGVLSDAAIDWVIDAYTHGRVADAQMSALLMAIFLRGMSTAEIARWTAAMIASGERLDFTDLRRDGKPLRLVDKHSTGGVGDKITIPLVPMVMACGGAVPQAAGRGLGHTGGTLDKLEAIPGFTAEITKGRDPPTTLRPRCGDLRGRGPRACRPEALCAARRHRHHRVDAADRQLDHEQEDRRGHQRSGARRRKSAPGHSSKLRGRVAGAGPHHGRTRDRAGVRTRRCSPRCTHRWAAPAAMPSRSPNRWRYWPAVVPTDVVELTLAWRARCASGGIDGVDPAQTLRDGRAMDRFREASIAAQGGDADGPSA